MIGDDGTDTSTGRAPKWIQRASASPRQTRALLAALAVFGIVAGLVTGAVLAAAESGARQNEVRVRCGNRGHQLALAVNRTAALLYAVARTLPAQYDADAFARAANVTLAAGMAAMAITVVVRQNRSAGVTAVSYPLLWSTDSRQPIGSELGLHGAADSGPISTNGSSVPIGACTAAVTVVAKGDPFLAVAPVCLKDSLAAGGKYDDRQPVLVDAGRRGVRSEAVIIPVLDRAFVMTCEDRGLATALPTAVGAVVAGAVLALDLAIGLHLARMRRAQATWAAEVAEERRRHQQAEQVSERRGEFVYGLGRRLRTVAHAAADLVAFAQRAGSGPNRDLRVSLQLLDQHVQSIGAVCDQVTDLTEMSRGHFQLERVPFSLRALLDQLDHRLRPIAEAKGLEFVLSPDSNVPAQAIGDQRRLYQVLFNAISNAIKFTERGTVSVTARTVAARTGSGTGVPPVTLEFTVVDSGPGFSSGMLRTLMELDDNDFLSTAQVGLGFITMKKLCVLMGGNVIIESEPSGSARLRLRVVVGYDRSNRESVLDGPAPASPGSPRSRSGTGVDVLLVEDNPTSAKIAMHMLQNVRNLRVVLVGDGAQALAAVGVPDPTTRQADFALVLMDVSLPNMDGNEATRRMRSAGLTLPIVAMTASSLPHQHRASTQAGMNDVLVKPFTRTQLLELIASYTHVQMDDAQQAGAGTAPVPVLAQSTTPTLRLRPSF